MAQTSCTSMQSLGFFSERCVCGWLISLNCSSYDGKNGVGALFWPWINNLQCRNTSFKYGELSCRWWAFPLLYARLEIFSYSRKPCHFFTLWFLYVNGLQSMKIFFHLGLFLSWCPKWENWTTDQMHGSPFLLFSESKVHISQLITVGETSGVRKIISVSRCGEASFFLGAVEK